MSSLFTVVMIVAFAAAIVGLFYAGLNYVQVKQEKEGTEEMSQIAESIRIGAMTFLKYEYRVLVITCVVIMVLLCMFISFESALAFLLGAVMSGLAGFIGMKSATYSNVRVTNKALETHNIGKTLHVALKGGSVMGLCVAGFGLLGLSICIIIFNYQLSNLTGVTNWIGLKFIPFPMTISCYALGCSVIAIFNRIGGGIFTKAADMGADLVGKNEANIEEDDPRNPATIADNVGDNVGDVAGLGSDLLESYVGAIASAIIVTIHLVLSYTAKGISIDTTVLERLYLYPVVFAASGLLSSAIGLEFVITGNLEDNPHKELNKATLISAGATAFSTFCVTYFFFGNVDVSAFFTVGFVSPWIAALAGIVGGILIGEIAEYYTSYSYNPTQKIALYSKEGPAITITQGLSVGMKSCMASCTVLAIALMLSYCFADVYGVAMAAVGMLSFVATTVSVDTYGPIADNAGGIAEMAKLPKEVRAITDKLDAVGNTTAAIGKGFAIGSATFAAISLMVSYLYSFNELGTELVMNLMNILVFGGVLVGLALPWMFSGLLIEAVSKAANKMVEEVRRQFREIPGILKGTDKPDYKTCIAISTQGALAEMKIPAIIAIASPIACGLVFGPYFVGGLLLGATLSAIVLAVFCGNAGGAWDNAKKFLETGAIDGEGKGSYAHKASVVGDTVGDPLKDTVGPSLDILIKIMSTVSLIAASIFSTYNLVDWISSL